MSHFLIKGVVERNILSSTTSKTGVIRYSLSSFNFTLLAAVCIGMER